MDIKKILMAASMSAMVAATGCNNNPNDNSNLTAGSSTANNNAATDNNSATGNHYGDNYNPDEMGYSDSDNYGYNGTILNDGGYVGNYDRYDGLGADYEANLYEPEQNYVNNDNVTIGDNGYREGYNEYNHNAAGLTNGINRAAHGVTNGINRVVNGTARGVERVVDGTANGVNTIVGGTANGVERVVDGTANGVDRLLNGNTKNTRRALNTNVTNNVIASSNK